MDKTNNIPTISEAVENKNDCKEAEADSEKTKHKKFTCKQKISLVMLAAVDFMSFCSMSIMAPFYPAEATKKGMTESMAGFVFGFYALVIFLSSPVFGKILPKIGLKFTFTGGVLFSGLCCLVFGTIDSIENYTLFTTFSFLMCGLEALGASAYSTASYVLVLNIFPNDVGAVRGLLETFVGLGLSVGPAIGGFLFGIGGFGLPFYVIGAVIILIAPLSAYLLPSSDKFAVEANNGSITKLLKLMPVVTTCLIIVVISMTWSFLDPTLEPHLRKFKLSPGNIGLIFLLLSATYGIFSPAWGWVTDRMDRYWRLMILGLFLNFISLLFLGPSPILFFLEDSIWLNIIALSTLGISVAMSLMPTFQAIVDYSLEGGFSDNLGTHSVISGLWSCVYSLGEVLGPVLGGTLLQNFGFSWTSTVFAILNLVMALLGLSYFFLKEKANVKSEFHEDKTGPQIYRKKNTDIIPEIKIGKIENGKWNAKLK